MIEKETIFIVKERADILEVIGDFVKLKKRGNNYVGLSPFSNERTPSFMVSPSKNIFKDFSSGKGGDLIEFLMQYLHIKYFEAIVWLAEKYKINIQHDLDFKYEPYKKEYQEIPTSYLCDTDLILSGFDCNPLYIFISNIFGIEKTKEVFIKYKIGAINDWIIFWLIDSHFKIRSGKYIKYKSDGHRCKETNASWHHKKTKEYLPVYPDFNLVQCFFGEHLVLNDIQKPIAIVESEKTAIIASLFIDRYIWVACGSKYGLNDIKCSSIANRSVTLFPDLGAYKEWYLLAKRYGYSINDKIEKIATDADRKNGLDLADYLLR